MTRRAADDLTGMAQYYDLLHREVVTRRLHHLLDGLAEAPRVGVVDIAAGTGLMAQALAHRLPRVPVTAVEPSASMRIAMFTSMAADPVMRAGVRVLPVEAERLDLEGGNDLALCLWAMHSFEPQHRHDIWRRIRRCLVPGGAFLVERPSVARPTPLTLEEHELGRAEIGAEIVVLTCSTRSVGPETQDWTFRYRHLDASGDLVQEWVGGGESWRVGDDDLVGELSTAGFTIERTIPDLEPGSGSEAGEIYVTRANVT